MSDLCFVLDLCELLCHRFTVDLFGNNAAAASPPVLLGAKQRRVVLGRFELFFLCGTLPENEMSHRQVTCPVLVRVN